MIGEGGMGRVYRARHAELGRIYAVKAMFGDLAANELMRARFTREATLASRLSHRNVVPVLDFGMEDDSVAFLVMEFMEGVSLAHELDTHIRLEPARVQRLAEGLARGLRHAHEKGLVHRDLKPDNVMLVTEDGEEVPKILDFGIAMPANATKQDRLTSTGNIVGTPVYMAPEQAFGEEIGPSADLYALGGVLFTCLTGRPPFVGDVRVILHDKITEAAPGVMQHAPNPVPGPLATLTDQLLSRRPQDRPQSAQEVLDFLAARERGATALTVDQAAPDAVEELLPVDPDGSGRFKWLMVGGLLLAAAGWFAISQLGAGGTIQAEPSRLVPAPPIAAEALPEPEVADPAPLPAAEEGSEDTRPPGDAVEARVKTARRKRSAGSAPPAPGRDVSPLPAAGAGREPAAGAEREPAAGAGREPAAGAEREPGLAGEREPTPVAGRAPAPVAGRESAPSPESSYAIKPFTDAYVRLGRRLEVAQGDASVADLKARYLRIPFADGLRVQSVRRDAMQELHAIDSELSRRHRP